MSAARIGLIPFLNVVPFHQSFVQSSSSAVTGGGPISFPSSPAVVGRGSINKDSFRMGPPPVAAGDDEVKTGDDGIKWTFQKMDPRTLGQAAAEGLIDAGPLSLVDYLRLADDFEPLGNFGIGVRERVDSVLLYSRDGIQNLRGQCAVVETTSTSVQLLDILLTNRYNNPSVTYGRVASAEMYDGDCDGLLLIGDEALRAAKTGIKGLSAKTDLAAEWFAWHGKPFAFALWAVRRSLPKATKDALKDMLAESLEKTDAALTSIAAEAAALHGFTTADVVSYWKNFVYELEDGHWQSIELFNSLIGGRHAVGAAR